MLQQNSILLQSGWFVPDSGIYILTRKTKFTVSVKLKISVKLIQQKKKEEIDFLINATMEDSIIKQRIIKLLQMKSYERRSVLNIWLEQLRLQNAPRELQHALFLMFDNSIAEQTLRMINGTYKMS